MVSTAASFFTVSVVMMAWAAASLPAPLRSRRLASSSMPSSMTFTLRVWPMTPVEHTSTSSAPQPMALAAAAHIRSAFSSPRGAQALALPLLATTARARPFARWAFVTWMGAAFTTLVVNTAAAAQSESETMRATSFLFTLWVLTPTWSPAARNPWAAHTPPSIHDTMYLTPNLSQPGRLVKAEHQIHILHCGAGGSLT